MNPPESITSSAVPDLPAELAAQFLAFRQSNPKVRIRDAASTLGKSEAELLATGVTGRITRLKPPFGPLLAELERLGPVMCLTRNAHAVHERRGTWQNIEVSPQHVLVVGEDIDLRIFPGRWHLGFAVEETVRDGLRRSLQFFDPHGDAVQKIYCEDRTDLAQYETLVTRFSAAEGPAPLGLRPRPAKAGPAGDANAVDVLRLREEWAALADPHDFFGMLRRLKLSRTAALAAVGAPWAVPVRPEAFDYALSESARRELPIMVFVGNPGCIQIHTGLVRNVRRTGDWMNVLDPAFNLHVRTDRIVQAFLVRKPSAEGPVTSLECFDAEGELILQLFGKRKPGIPELAAWRELADALPEVGA